MTIHCPRTRLATTIALVLSLSTSVHAQSESPDTEKTATPKKTHRAEQVVVTAKGTAADAPDALAVEVIQAEDAIARPTDFQDLITHVPGVGATGQNGLFETFSIRGSGANNIAILFAGMPLAAQRRAGVPVAFVEPSLLGEIAVTRGPAVVHYGPGALGGAVSVEPRWFELPYASASYARGGDEYVVAGGFGSEQFSVGVAQHSVNRTQSADGTPLNTAFDRASAVLQYRREVGDLVVDAMLSPSRSEDIGKSNSRFPGRNTIYPHDTHSVGRLRLRHANGFEFSLHGHDQSLRTWNRRPGRADTFADVKSFDFAATAQQTLVAGDAEFNVGIDYSGRRHVDAFDASGSIDNRNYTLDDAQEDGWSLFAISDWSVTPDLTLEFGARHSGIDQSQAAASPNDQATGLTAGALWRPNAAHRLSLSLASGYRFATLEERFFTGVTAQGEVVGNPDLGSESSVGIDLGHAWHGTHWQSEVHLWRTKVDDLIQLIEVAPGINGFENVSEARLWGGEAMLGYTPTDALSLRGNVAVVRSHDEGSGDPLYGSPPTSAGIEVSYRFAEAFTAKAGYTHRFAMKRPGFEEVERDAADLVDAELDYDLGGDLYLGIFGRNLLDENYFATADELSALATERSFGLHVTWRPR